MQNINLEIVESHQVAKIIDSCSEKEKNIFDGLKWTVSRDPYGNNQDNKCFLIDDKCYIIKSNNILLTYIILTDSKVEIINIHID